MIREYYRPHTLDEALTLLTQPNTVPLGGGTLLSQRMPFDAAQGRADSVSVVDLQSLGLNTVKKQGNNLEIGATTTLQQLLEDGNCPAALKTAIKLEAPLNLRNSATVAGTLVSCDGRSTFATVMLALDAKLMASGKQKAEDIINIGDLLPLRSVLGGRLITKVTVPLNVKLAFEYVSRTPADKPIVCAALAQWNSGRARLAVGGYGRSPMLAMDGTEADASDASTSDFVLRSAQAAARNAFHEATDEWASAEYRSEVAAVLAKRCITGQPA